jgi:hypothetical protein
VWDRTAVWLAATTLDPADVAEATLVKGNEERSVITLI